MNLPIISRIKATRPIRSGEIPVPTISRQQACRRSSVSALLVLSLVPTVMAAPFTSGNLVIYRVGDGVAPLSNTGATVFLDEYSPSGTLVQSMPMPAVLPASPLLVASGTATSEGEITRSVDGRYLALTGYNSNIPYSSSLASSPSNSVFRTIGRVDWNGNIDTSTVLEDFADGSNPRSALSTDGTSFWVAGGAGGVRYASLGTNTTSTQISTGLPTNLRQINVFDGQLYASSGSGTTVRLATVGSGLSTSAGQGITNLPGFPTTGSPYAFFFADLTSSVSGVDTLYVADDLAGLQKFSLVAGSWTANGTIGTDADDYRGLTATVAGNAVNLYATIKGGSTSLGGGELVKLTDTSGYNGAITATLTPLAEAATNTAFRGVALAPYSRPDLTVDLAAPPTALAGNSFNYTLTARNNGNIAASGISIGLLVPAGLTVGTINGASGFTGLSSGPLVNFTGGSLAAGASASLTVSVSSPTAATYTTVVQAAFVDPGNAISEADETNNGSTQLVSTVVTGTGIAPTVTTAPASAITETTATLNGTINPNGYATTAQFEYGLTTAYGSTANFALSPNNGNSAQSVTANLTGLQAGQTYHYRLTATNSGGPGAGVNRTFSTYPAVPFIYTVSAGQVTITGYTGPGGVVTIPSTIIGLPVVAIGANAFREISAITAVTIPNSVTSIGAAAFFGCTGLTSVTLPNGLLSIGQLAFQSCIRLTGIVIPDSVTDIGNQAFKSCNVLTSATLPIGLTIIANSLFAGCVALTQINIPATVTSIETGAFQSCHSLVSITLPNGLVTIQSDAFAGCISLASITIPSSVTTIGTSAFRACPQLTSANFQGNAPTMGAQVFEGSSTFTVYFMQGRTGFTSPTWLGYPSVGLSAPTITTQPASQTIASGSSVTLSVVATGSPAPSYQWYQGNSGDTTTPVGTNSASFTTPVLTANTNYWVRASNTSGAAASSNTATITVTIGPKLVVSEVAPWSSFSSPVAADWFEVTNIGDAAASVSGWRIDDSSGLFGSAAVLNGITSIAPGEAVIFLETDDLVGASAAFKTLWFGDSPVGNLQIGSYTGAGVGLSSLGDGVYLFDSIGNLVTGVRFGFSPTSPLATFDNSIGSGNSTIPGPNISALSAVGINGAFTAVNDPQEIGSPGNIQPLAAAPIITTQPVSQTIPSGSSTTLSVLASGSPAPTFQWYRGDSGDTSNPFSGATFAVFTINGITTTTSYWVRASNTSGSAANSNTATITVTVPPAITTQPASQGILSGNTATLTVAASGQPSPTFQWYRGNSGDTSTPVGTNSASFTTPALTTTASYWVQASNTSGPAANSNTATITVTPPPTPYFGVTNVFLNGIQAGGGLDGVRNQETNLGNLVADGLLDHARSVGPCALALINGGSLRASVGELIPDAGTPGGFVRLPPPADPPLGLPVGAVTQADIETTLLFNDGLTLLTVSRAELRAILEHGVANFSSYPAFGSPRFPQISGLRMSFDPSRPAGDRIRSVALLDLNGNFSEALVSNGVIVGDPSASLRVVTYDFLADGGDLYPFPSTPAANRIDLKAAEAAARTGMATFTVDGSLQDVFAEYLTGRHPVGAPYSNADTTGEFDTRIQNLAVRNDAVFDGAVLPPSITTQPASQTITNGATAMLSVVATGSPAADFQWFKGNSGDTTNPILNANSATFTTPALTATTSYWVRATNTSGIPANSDTAVISIASSNNNLSDLALGEGTLTPAFDPATLSFGANVLSSTISISVSATKAQADASLQARINGGDFVNIVSAVPSSSFGLDVGLNTLEVKVTAQDSSTKTYTVGITRAAPIPLTTEPASDVATFLATFNGTVTPNGPATVYFRYGLTTSYGNRTPDLAVSGNTLQPISTPVSGLISNRLYHYQLVAENGTETFYGNSRTFTTAQGDPIAVTGTPFGVTTAQANLVGAVDLRGLSGSVFFEYGQKNGLISTSPQQPLTAANGVRDINALITELIPNQIYVYRIVATSAGGTRRGADVEFTATTTGGGGTGTPSGPPTAITGGATDIQATSALLAGSSDSRGGSTAVYFEYGTTTSYGQRTESKGIGNVTEAASFSIRANGLNPGTLYHYRLVAENSAGVTSAANEGTFTTRYLAPSVSTDAVSLVSTTSVRLFGTVGANGLASVPKFRYGTSPTLLTTVKDAVPSPITGYAPTTVNAEIENLRQGTTYYYQLEASNTASDTGTGFVRSFDVGVLSGMDQRFPDEIQAADLQGSLLVTLTPPAIGSGWRFAGEPGWRPSGSSASGLTAGDRVVEYRPVASHLQPQSETVVIPTGSSPVELSRNYQTTGQAGSGSLRVVLKPDSVANTSLPVAGRAQWKLVGESAWRDSGSVASGLQPGGYVIEAKQIPDRDTPAPTTAVVANGQETTASITYYLAAPLIGASPAILGFSEVSTDETKPFGYVGQILTDAGAGTGFAVKPRVIATAGHVMFDSAKLASATGVRWLFQRDAGFHEPVPVQPRGFYLMTGYAAQRAVENTPGESTPASQNLDAAAMYFTADVSRNGYSGYLASDLTENEFVVSSLQKTMVGYPVERVPLGSIGKMHATPASPVVFASAFGRTCTTAQIRGGGGISGGPLCVQTNTGTWYPAAIFLGGNNQTVVRTIDSEVVDLFGFAEASATSPVGATGGVGTVTMTDIGGTAGAVTVLIGPTGARAAGAGWRINADDSYQISGAQITSNPNTYTVQLSTVPGFVPPTPQTVQVIAGKLTLLNFTYEEIILPPVITSASGIAVARGQPLGYLITASNGPQAFNLLGNLPTGLSFNPLTGSVSGTALETGLFPVIVSAENSGGVGTKQVTFSSLPVISGQSVAAIRNQALNYQMQSSESGGLSWSASDLPDGLSISATSGVISGAPNFAGNFTAQVAVTKNGATSFVAVGFNITGAPPVFTVQPSATRSVEFGTSTTFTVAASGEPTPRFQWFRGLSGDTSQELIGATSATLNTLPLVANASYWVQATSISGTANSTAVVVSLSPSTNPNLSGLATSSGSLVPAFNPTVSAYQMTADQAVGSISLTPFVQISQTTVRVNNLPVMPGSPSAALPLAVGPNNIQIETRAGDGTLKNYTIQVTRLSPPVPPVTGAASGITHFSANLNATVTPNGSGEYYFEYGPSDAYGSRTNSQSISAQQAVAVSQSITSLGSSTEYYYRIVFQADGAPLFGQPRTFTTAASPPLVFTGNPVNVTTASARFTGGVDPKGLPFSYKFYYGQTEALGTEVALPQRNPNFNGNPVDVFFDLPGVIPNATYFYQLEATTTGGTVKGNVIQFTADTSGGTGDGIADSPPTVVTLAATDRNTYSAVLNGSVIPNDGATLVWFEYGTSNTYGRTTEPRELIGNGNQLRLAEPVLIAGLEPATEYHFRIRAINSKGETSGGNVTFTTVFNPPLAYVGTAEATSPNSVRVSGQIDPRGASAVVSFEYGTDGVNFPFEEVITTSPLNGSVIMPIEAALNDLKPSVTYHFRVRAQRTGEPAVFSAVSTFQLGALLGLVQEFPLTTPVSERSGQLIVTSLPAGTGAWRFTGETKWRAIGIPATGLTTSDRVIEFQPVFGLIQPPAELVSIVSGQPAATVEGLYYDSASPGTAALTVAILPISVSDPAVTIASRAQWRLAGVSGDPWRNSGDSVLELPNGTHLVEFKPIPSRRTPTPRIVEVGYDEARFITETYFPATSPILNPPAPISYEAVIENTSLPHAFVGQLRSDAGTYSGFVVKKRVVATAAQAVVNEDTLTVAGNLQWLWLPDQGNHENKPINPRGVYIFTGYAAQREVEENPGTLSTASHNQNVAAVFFSENAAQGGFSGFRSSDAEINPYLVSGDLKTLAGYPVAGVSPTNLGRLHATSPSASLFTKLFDRTYESTSIRGFGGMVGGPLSIRSSGGAYYPSAIYVGGTNRGIVRGIDSNVIDLFSRADSSANGGDDDVGGGISLTGFVAIGASSDPGAIILTIEPASALALAPTWKLTSGVDTALALSGARKGELTAGSYSVSLSAIPGFETPGLKTVTIEGGKLNKYTFTYRASNSAPSISTTGNLSISEDASGGPLTITLSDPDDAASTLEVKGASSNTTLIPQKNITFGGSGANRTVRLTPVANQTGMATITLTVSDGSLESKDTFSVTVAPVNDRPTISTITNQSIAVNTPDPVIPFMVSDLETPLASLMMSATSSNLALVPESSVVFSGSGMNRMITVTPLSGKLGTTTISLSVSDGVLSADTTFILTVTGSATEMWRAQNFNSAINSGPGADIADPDGDGSTNIAEYTAGTNPMSAVDVFRVSAATKTGNLFSITVQGRTGRRYVLQRRTDLPTGSWTPVASTSPLAADAVISLTDPNASATRGFYRVTTELANP